MNNAAHEAWEALAESRTALLEGRTDICAQALARFEAAIEAAPPPPDELRRLQARVAALGQLTRAAMDGIAAARAQLASVVAEAGRLGTYDSDGRRDDRSLRSGRARRY